MERGYTGFSMYGRSKLMNILFTREVARRLEGTGVTANCLHPGFVATRFGDASGGIGAFVVKTAKRFALTPEEGAKTIIYLASSPEVNGVTGKYFHKCQQELPSAEAQNDEDARRLWDVSVQLTSVGAEAIA
jgi:NAD(P)-dependent dehydrogenase (short-subunit alcohol dehydrogenase family)